MAKYNSLRRVASHIINWNPELWHGAKYRLYRDLLRNPPSARKFKTQGPVLNACQSRIVKELTMRGVAFSSFSELFDNPKRWERLSKAVDSFSSSERVQKGISEFESDHRHAGKEYEIKEYPKYSTINLDNIWLQLGVDAILLDAANSYLGMWGKLIHVDLWYTVPANEDWAAIASQRWHRDADDERIFKVFLYFSEVDEAAGALQYIAGSAQGGPYQNRWPKRTVTDAEYPPEEEVEESIPRCDRISCVGGPGTLVFCDTNGLHRGGFSTSRPRILATWSYVTPASLFPRRFSVDWNQGVDNLSEAARFALT